MRVVCGLFDTIAAFSACESVKNQIYAVQVYDSDKIVGFYMMKCKGDCIHLLYLYYLDEAQQQVFASIRDHCIKLNISQLTAEHTGLINYIRKQLYFPNYHEVDISFSYPKCIDLPESYTLQYGDGDNFTI